MTLKAQKISRGYKKTEIGVIPENWDVKKLGELADIVSGGTPSTLIKDYWNGNINWCTPTDITNTQGKYIFRTERTISEKGLKHSSACMLPVGSLLLCSRATIGELRISKVPITTNQGFKSLIPHESTDIEFLYYKVLTLKKEFIEKAIGSTFLEISKKDTYSVKLAIPKNKDERMAIATALSDVDSLIEKLEKLIEKKKLIKRGTMQELLTGKKRLPGFSGTWKMKDLGELFNFSGGLSASRDQLTFEGYCYLHYGDIHMSKKTYIDVAAEKNNIPKLDIPLSKVSRASLLDDGDIVFVDASEDDEGASKHVVIVNKDRTPFIAGLHTIVAKSKTNDLEHKYLRYCFQTFDVKNQFLFYAVGTKVTGISKTNIAKIKVPMPSVPEQSAIATILADMDTEIEKLESELAKYKNIKQGIMQMLLTGKIRLFSK